MSYRRFRVDGDALEQAVRRMAAQAFSGLTVVGFSMGSFGDDGSEESAAVDPSGPSLDEFEDEEEIVSHGIVIFVIVSPRPGNVQTDSLP